MRALIALMTFALAAPLWAQDDYSPYSEKQLTQYSTIDALLAGVYDGRMSVAELKQHGDFGLGTFNGLDGELLMLDGVVYQLPAEGKTSIAPDELNTPFVTMCYFEPTQTIRLTGPATMNEVRASLEGRLFKIGNIFYAVKFEGTFTKVKARSPHKQERPYKPISDVIEGQAVFEFENIEGTMVGFWCPKFISGLNVSGWHMHFISKDKTQGGHVLDYSIGDIEVAYMEMMRFELLLPRENEFFNANFDFSRELLIHEVESGKPQ